MTISDGRLQPCLYRFIVLRIMALSAVAHFGPASPFGRPPNLSGIAMVWCRRPSTSRWKY